MFYVAPPIPPSKSPKLLHLQILRTLAASLVVVDHTYNELYHRGVLPAGHLDAAYLLGHLGVSAFFVLSGFIMMRQSAANFGQPGSPLAFAWHRILRIVPLYWIATLLWFATLRFSRTDVPHPLLQIGLSLSFLPNVLNPRKLDPILGQGWTLNYEMVFYALFALCLFFPRKRALRILFGVLVPAALLGRFVSVTQLYRLHDLWGFYTYWLIILFAAGVGLALIEMRFGRVDRRSLAISPAWLLCLPMLMLLFSRSPLPNAGATLKWFSFFGAIVVVLCTLVRLEHPSWFNRVLILLGDASYSTYLFHVWVYAWIIPPIAALTAHFQRSNHPIPFVVAAVVTANLLGLAIHLGVERPLTRVLRKVKIGEAKSPQPALT